MRCVLKVALCCAAVLAAASNTSLSWAGRLEADNSATESPRIAVEAVNSFAFRMYHQLAKENENLFFSPSSIWSAFAMALAGARGQNEAQLMKALQLPAGGDQVHAAYAALDKELAQASRDGSTLKTATALWGQKGEPFLDEFLRACKTYYRGGFKTVDFARAPEAARTQINQWVLDQTNQKIRDLIPPPLSGDTRLVLASAIWFKGKWESPFKPRYTKVEPFTCLDGTKAKAPLMHQAVHFGYAEAEGLQLLELPYEHGLMSLVVILPGDTKAFQRFEKSLDLPRVTKWLALMRPTTVEVYLPKFRIETASYDLKPPVIAMGARDAFSPRAADFSAMLPNPPLYIGMAVHKAFVDVAEEGTEAAGATAIGMRLGALPTEKPKPPPVFRADRPFVFLIRHKPTGCILFVGRLVKPQG